MRLEIFRLLVHVVVLEFWIEVLAAADDHADQVETYATKNRENHHQECEDGVTGSIATTFDHRYAARGTGKIEKVHEKFRG